MITPKIPKRLNINYFLPLVNDILSNHNPVTDDSNIQKYVIVTADFLNVRESFNASSKLAADRAPVQMGSILRVYVENDGWLKISNSQNHWVSARHSDAVERYIVNNTTLNVRSGPGVNYPKIGQIYKNEQVFIIQEEGSWAKIAMDNRWVSKRYLDGF